MDIIREGKGITLTRSELVQAYYACEHMFDEEYISGSLLEQYEDGDDVPKGMPERLRKDPVFRSRVAYKYRKFLDDQYGSDTEWECLKDAYNYAKEA